MDVVDILMAKALSGGGGGGDSSVLTVGTTKSGSVYTTDKTFKEIKDAMAEGKIVAIYGIRDNYPFTQFVIFAGNDPMNGYYYITVAGTQNAFATCAAENDYMTFY